MAEGQRYYWLRLHDDFFDSKRIKKLRSFAGGDTFTIIYLKMQLKAIRSEGILKYTGVETTVADEIALDIDENPDNVKITLDYLINVGLAELSEDQDVFLPYAVENTGSEGSSAQRMREARKKQSALQCANNVRTMCEHRDGEIEKEKEIEIYNSIAPGARAREGKYDFRYEDIPKAYLDEVLPRIEAANKEAVAMSWWDRDKENWKPTKTGSFDTDEFFNAAVSRSLGSESEDVK